MTETMGNIPQAASGAAQKKALVDEIRRILDEHSAWIARPNPEIERLIALAACASALKVMEVWAAGDEASPIPCDTIINPSLAARDVLAERRRQIEVEGWTPEHDDRHPGGTLSFAAAAYAIHGSFPNADREQFEDVPPPEFPWEKHWWKPTSRRRDLVKAGALILAEIERIDRADPPESSHG